MPENLEAGTVSVKVMRSDGVFAAEDLKLQIADQRPSVTAVQPTRIVLGVDQHVVVHGTGFGNPDLNETPGVLLHGRELQVIEYKGWGPTTIRAKLPTAEEAEVQAYKLPGTAELNVLDARGHRSAATTVELEAKKEAKPANADKVDVDNQVEVAGNGRADTQDPPQPLPRR